MIRSHHRAHPRNSAVVLALLVAAGCNRLNSDNSPVAYVAPATLNLRSQVTQKNSSVALLRHGDRLSVLEVRRRFVKVRTAKGAEGWVDATQLLTADKMADIERANRAALRLPSEGAAGVYEPLNIHLEPSRQSPAFDRIADNGSVEVLAHKLVPKVEGPPPIPLFTLPKFAAARKPDRKAREQKNSFPLPKIILPKPPADADRYTSLATDAKPSAAAPPKPVVMEDWTQIRTKDKHIGWVLTRNLVMSIPDDVAQYAEGRRITSYFSLGSVNDEAKGKKNNWLWTTLSGQANYDFDSWRVFLWNRRRHRYETSYRQRDLEGYFPVKVDPNPTDFGDRRFSLIVKEDNGQLLLKSYRFDGTRVHADGVAPVTR